MLVAIIRRRLGVIAVVGRRLLERLTWKPVK
jgi:hypothetical protein